MCDFTVLPPEILYHILSHINQVDCIECIFVCRRWYKLIPQYCKDDWKEHEISEKSWPKFNNAMLECLQMHLTKVSNSSFQNLYKILQQLKRRKFNIQFLGNLIFVFIAVNRKKKAKYAHACYYYNDRNQR